MRGVKRENLVGIKNNRLIVLEMLDKDSPEVQQYSKNTRGSYVKCKCDCGKIKITKSYDFKHGICKSCGCLISEMAYKQMKRYCKYDLVSNNNYGIGISLNGYKFYFDLEDYDKIKEYGWNYHKDYITSHNIPKNPLFDMDNILIHRFIMNCTDKNKEVDHINHDTFDNRKVNLRIVNKNENMQNKIIQKNNKSGFKGVSLASKKYGGWVANIGFKGKQIYLGNFKNKEDAIKARKEAEELYHGKFSYKNSINGGNNESK